MWILKYIQMLYVCMYSFFYFLLNYCFLPTEVKRIVIWLVDSSIVGLYYMNWIVLSNFLLQHDAQSTFPNIL